MTFYDPRDLENCCNLLFAAIAGNAVIELVYGLLVNADAVEIFHRLRGHELRSLLLEYLEACWVYLLDLCAILKLAPSRLNGDLHAEDIAQISVTKPLQYR